jgi:hypothetical protein
MRGFRSEHHPVSLADTPPKRGIFLKFHPQKRMKSTPPVASGDLKRRFPVGKADGEFLSVFRK